MGLNIQSVSADRALLTAMGILSIMFGIAGLYLSIAMSVASMIIFGVFIVIVGFTVLFDAFSAPKWSGKPLSLLLALLYIVAGMIIASDPLVSAMWFTLLMSSFFIVVGIFRILTGLRAKAEVNGTGWLVFAGLVDILLGVLLYEHWPVSGLIAIGIFVSVDLIAQGAHSIALARTSKAMETE